MLSDQTPRDKLIRAAMVCAERYGWRDLTLDDVAEEAGLTLAELAGHFQSKTGILLAFQRAVDQAVLTKADIDPEEPSRDRVFDVIMTRLEILGPYKGAIVRIFDDVGPTRPGRAGRALLQSARSQSWMLRAAGIDPDGPTGGLRVTGMLTVYGQILPIWLDDDDPGLARTMAALDRRLRRGERWLVRAEGMLGAATRLASALAPRKSRRKPREAPAEPAPVPETNGAADPQAG